MTLVHALDPDSHLKTKKKCNLVHILFCLILIPNLTAIGIGASFFKLRNKMVNYRVRTGPPLPRLIERNSLLITTGYQLRVEF